MLAPNIPPQVPPNRQQAIASIPAEGDDQTMVRFMGSFYSLAISLKVTEILFTSTQRKSEAFLRSGSPSGDDGKPGEEDQKKSCIVVPVTRGKAPRHTVYTRKRVQGFEFPQELSLFSFTFAQQKLSRESSAISEFNGKHCQGPRACNPSSPFFSRADKQLKEKKLRLPSPC